MVGGQVRTMTMLTGAAPLLADGRWDALRARSKTPNPPSGSQICGLPTDQRSTPSTSRERIWWYPWLDNLAFPSSNFSACIFCHFDREVVQLFFFVGLLRVQDLRNNAVRTFVPYSRNRREGSDIRIRRHYFVLQPLVLSTYLWNTCGYESVSFSGSNTTTR